MTSREIEVAAKATTTTAKRSKKKTGVYKSTRGGRRDVDGRKRQRKRDE